MTDKTEAQPEALELADRLMGNAQIDECEGCNPLVIALERSAAAELRRQHAEIQQLKAQLSARQAAPDGWRLVPVEVVNLYDFMCLAFVPMTGQHEQIAISLKLAKAAMLSAAPPPPEREPLTPDSSDVVTDEEMQSAFAGTNFGTKAYRHLLHQALLKKACEYHCGHTITQIMKELGLIGVTGRPLQKGIKMLRIAYREQMMEGP
ncbi:hypothetical protein [Comamonas koreensis]|uniref:hypothetical protein n=1 Tax=Comamonas koreensis TaxID=160825 RepID=UPI0015FD31D6|nr:hypothetical protein [Comamonas koreensis]